MNKKIKIFNQYDHNNDGLLSKRDIVKMMKIEFKMKHNKTTINSLMSIWGKRVNNRLYITKDIFLKLFNEPNGFFKNVYI